MTNRLRSLLGTAAFVLCAGSFAHSEETLRLAPPFSDGMVVQQGRPLIVRGWDQPRQNVRVTFAGQSARGTAADDGRWQIEIPSPAPGGPYEMQIEGSESLTLRNILSGEVWLAAGQSNMAWPVRKCVEHEAILATMPQPRIRFFRPPFASTAEPQESIDATWQAATADTVGNFSGVAYQFAKRMQEALGGVPIGIIEVARGATPIAAFLPVQDFQALGIYDQAVARHAAQNADWQRRVAEWQAQGEKIRKPIAFGGNEQHRPAGVDNAMIQPLKPFPIRGVIWYQGEEDTIDPAPYPRLFTQLVKSWRRDFRDPELPVYFVQLADQVLDDKRFAEFRPMQEALSLTVPGVDMVVSIGAGRPGIHPPEKGPIGERLARMALAHTHGQNILPGGPRLADLTEKDGAWLLRFDRVGEGLKFDPPLDDRIFRWVRIQDHRHTVSGAGGKNFPRWQRVDSYIPARAELLAPDTLRVPLPGDGQPVDGLEYNILGNARPVIFNSENLPASPFRVAAPADHQP